MPRRPTRSVCPRAQPLWVAAVAIVVSTAAPTAARVSLTELTAFASADLTITKSEGIDPVIAGTDLAYTIEVGNAGSGPADNASWSDTLPTGTTFVSLAEEPGWSCSTPGVGSDGTVSCSIASLGVGSASFTLTVHVDPAVAEGTVLQNTATATSATGDSSATETTTVVSDANFVAAKNGTPLEVDPGGDVAYDIVVANVGPSAAADVVFSDPLPAGSTFLSLSAPPGWACTTPAVGAGGTVTCSIASLLTSAEFHLAVTMGAALAGTTVTNVAFFDTPSSSGAVSASANADVLSPAAPAATKSASGSFAAGGVVTYTIVLTNSSAFGQGDNPGDELTDVLPAELTLVSASATAGTAVATIATNTVRWNGAIPGGGSVTITIQATIASETAPGTSVANQAVFAVDADGDGTSEASGVSDDPAAPGTADPTSFLVASPSIAEIPALGELGIGMLALLFGLLGAMALRCR